MFHPAFPPLVLASASPRRRDLLASLGLRFLVHTTDVPETSRDGEEGEGLVLRLAREKSTRCLAERPGCLALAADTVVTLQGPDGPVLLGKPRGRTEARAMLQRLSGTQHQVITGMVLAGPDGGRAEEVAVTRVTFASLAPALLEWYLSTGEPYDKAGAYGLQGRAAIFVSRLEGSWTNVVGLPLDRLPALFAAAGYDLVRLLGTGVGG